MSNVTFENLTKQYGEYKDTDGTEYCLKQYPYLDGTNEAPIYTANGYDRAGNPMRLTWEITNSETEDESEACDWDVFDARPYGGDYAPWSPDAL
jgi:hypothetical protein